MRRYSAPRPIAAGDDLTEFDSGEPDLDEWLRRRALANQAAGASRCFVTFREGRVVGYYALATATLGRSDVSPRIARGMPEPIPAILLGRLAVDREERGNGLGSNLLRDAIARTVEAADIIGVRVLLVHAMHDRARAFYLYHGFEVSPVDPMLVMLLIKDARAIVRRYHGQRDPGQ